MTPAEWADHYLTAKAEGSHTEATHIYTDAVMVLSYRDAREFAELIGETK